MRKSVSEGINEGRKDRTDGWAGQVGADGNQV